MGSNPEKPDWVQQHTDQLLGGPIFRTEFPQGPRLRTHDMFGYEDPSNGNLIFVIEGLDPTDFEAVVGPKVAQEYRDFVNVRRGLSIPSKPTRVTRILDRIGILR